MKQKILKQNTFYPLIPPPDWQTVQPRRWQIAPLELASLILAIIVFETAILSIEKANWINPQPSLTLALLFSVLTSVLLLKSRLPIWSVVSITLILGVLITVWQASNLFSAQENVSRISQLFSALQAWIHAIALGQPSEGTTHFSVFLVLFIWFSTFISIWMILRHQNVWPAIGLSAAIILINLSNLTESYYSYFFFYLIAIVILIGQVNLLNQTKVYGKNNVSNFYKKFLSIFFILICLGLSLSIAVWFLPGIRLAPASSTLVNSLPYKNNIDEFFLNFFARIPSRQPYIASGDSRMLSFRDSVDTSETVHFTISSKRPFYWRKYIYDQYLPSGWISSANSQITSQEVLKNPEPYNQVETNKISYKVVNQIKTDVILTTGKIVSLDLPFSGNILQPASYTISLVSSYNDNSLPPDIASLAKSLRAARANEKTYNFSEFISRLPEDLELKRIGETGYTPNEESFELLKRNRRLSSVEVTRKIISNNDIISLSARFFINPDNNYTGVSIINSPTAAQLSRAGEEYPHSITDYYLQLPLYFPDRVKQLAKTITGEAKTPYDKVLALKQYLSQIPYQENIVPGLEGVDGVDHFLFTQRIGNCFYFASAEIVMLRSIGIPSRMVVGYLPGDYDADKGAYKVRAKDYHSWVEVYFPQYGWVEFEVTPNTNTAGVSFVEDLGYIEDALFFEDLPPPTEDNLVTTEQIEKSFPFVSLVATLTLALFGSILYIWVKYLAGLDYPAKVYSITYFLASIARFKPGLSQTPLEFCNQLVTAFPGHTKAIRHIGKVYMDRQYGQRKLLDNIERNILTGNLRSLSVKLIKHSLLFWK